jgi:hypothetical protein
VLCHLWPPAGVEREDRLMPAGAQDPHLPDSELVATQSTRDRTGA